MVITNPHKSTINKSTPFFNSGMADYQRFLCGGVLRGNPLCGAVWIGPLDGTPFLG